MGLIEPQYECDFCKKVANAVKGLGCGLHRPENWRRVTVGVADSYDRDLTACDACAEGLLAMLPTFTEGVTEPVVSMTQSRMKELYDRLDRLEDWAEKHRTYHFGNPNIGFGLGAEAKAKEFCKGL